MHHEQPVIVDLIIPALNERASITAAVEGARRHGARLVVVVDNGSTDDTAQQAQRAGAVVVHEPQRGYGAACLTGIRALAADPPDAVAFMDADGSDDPAMLPHLMQALDRADLVIGSRVARALPGSLTPVQRFGNALATRLIRLITGYRYTDLGPQRIIRYPALQQLHMRDRTWGWTVEMQFKAARSGLRITEIDVPYHPRATGKSKISGSLLGSIRAGYKILWTLAALTLRR